MKLRTGSPWMPAPQYGHSLRGLTVNLLVRDIEGALPFHREVLGAEVVYRDPDVAEKATRRRGFTMLAEASDKPHGLREAYLLDTDGYLWAPDVPIGAGPPPAAR